VDMEAFEFCILRTPANAAELDEQTADRIQGEHLAYLRSLHEAGHTCATGPFGDRFDESLRGLVIYRTGSLDKARELAGQDPAVLAGQLEPMFMTWYTGAGTLSKPGTPVTF
jgi:uncharacterized protein YciI